MLGLLGLSRPGVGPHLGPKSFTGAEFGTAACEELRENPSPFRRRAVIAVVDHYGVIDGPDASTGRPHDAQDNPNGPKMARQMGRTRPQHYCTFTLKCDMVDLY
jgi:hypothetical protein